MTIDTNASDDGKLTARLGESATGPSKATISELSKTETEALLARMEPMPALDNSRAPVIRPPSAAPPRIGDTPPIAFVMATGKTIADKPVSDVPPDRPVLAPPQILPVGDVSAESEIRIRFREPMVPLSAVGATKTPVATIAPAVTGSWRWLDTRVALFTPTDKRLAKATEYTVTVPAGTKAVSGAVLGQDTVGTFSTPAVEVIGAYPRVKLRPDSPLLVELDQKIDPEKIIKFLRVEDTKRRKLPFERISLDEARKRWTKNPAIAGDSQKFEPNHVILAPRGSWPAGIEARVVLAPKAPSLEGPVLTTDDQGASFDVAPAFVARGVQCDEMERPRVTGAKCRSWGYLSVHFSNPIEPDTYKSTKVQIQGAPVYDHSLDGDSVTLETPILANKSYGIGIGGGIVDIYGQPLGGPKQLAFATTPYRWEPHLYARTGVYTLDPRHEIPQWRVDTQVVTSLDIELYQVEPKDFLAYLAYERATKTKPPLPGKRIYEKKHALGKQYGARARVDLRPALSKDGTGHVIAVATVTPAAGKLEPELRKRVAWIQVTKLGITGRYDRERMHVWTHDLRPGSFLAPIGGTEVSLIADGRTDGPAPATADKDGHAAFDLFPRIEHKPGEAWQRPTVMIVAKQGTDSSFMVFQNDYEKTVRREDVLWYVTDDRFTYKPGEPVYVKGWVRKTHDGTNPDLTIPTDDITYQLQDSRGNKIAGGTAKLTKHGGFDLEVALPPNVNTGRATFEITLSSGRSGSAARTRTTRWPISIEEFRTPAYAVTLTDDVLYSGARPLVLGESIAMSTEAKYYAGGGLPGADITWDARLESASYSPPGWDRYTFAQVRPRSEGRWHNWRRHRASTAASQAGTLSGASTSTIELGLTALPRKEPSLLEVDASVTDIDRQTIRATSRKILVHPSALYVGSRLRPDKHDRTTLQFVVTDIDGEPVAGVPIEVAIEGVLGSQAERDDADVIDKQSCNVVSAREPVTCGFTRKDYQTSYRAVARIKDARGRENTSALWVPWWSRADEDFSVKADKELYKPGDVAKLEIKSKRLPAVAVVSFARNGVVAQKRVEMKTETAVAELPIEASYIENVKVIVDLVVKRDHQRDGKHPRAKEPLPEMEQVKLDLKVDREFARLVMRTRPLQPLVEPGENATFEVEVKHEDKPVKGAEVALMVIDEAVLAISGKRHADPLEPFYREVSEGTWSMNSLGMIDDDADDLGAQPGFEQWKLEIGRWGSGTGSGFGYGSGSGSMGGRSHSVPSVKMGAFVRARKDFRATAVFSPKLETDEAGKVKVTVKMPDSLTRYRIVALASSTSQYFGKAENNIVAQLKLNARTVAPRFLTQGDRFSLPVVVQNLDSAPRTIDVAVRAGNLAAIGPQGKRVVVPGGERAEVRFELATQSRGKAVIQTIATSGTFADASNVEVPVWAPATTESFATYGSVTDKPVFEQLKVPADLFTEVGGIEAEISSTQLQNLTDAYWYLYEYPYECAEQRSGRMLATTALYDILDAFAIADRPTKQQLLDRRASDVKKLAREQKPDGGWGYFSTTESDPFVTMQVVSALGAQGDKGETTKRGIDFVTKFANKELARLEKQVKQRDVKLKRRPDDAAGVALVATALTSLQLAGVEVVPRVTRLHGAALALGSYPVDAKARLLALVAGKPAHKVMRAKLLAELLSATHETAAAATVTTSFTEEERLLLVSNVKTNALALDALLRESPQQAVITKLARGILDSRKRGRWMSTHENLVVMQAMRRYFDIYEKDTPNFTGKLWLGTAAYAEESFNGRTVKRATTHADWTTLKPGTATDIVIATSGTGRMYYRLGITYAPKQMNLPPLDAGFIVRRSYKAVDAPSDVVQLPDGSWKIKLGARVLVALEVINTSARHAVALVDPMPAGIESVNTRLATSERAVVDLEADRWDHVQMRSNRSEAFTMHLGEGTHRFSYTARATTPGTFIAAPAKAEEMYSPETFGRSAGTTVVIE